jgi:DNA-binding NarL/FixJ family response regulator
MITIALAEDHNIVRQGFKALLEAQGDFRIVGEAVDGLEAVQLVEKRGRPNVLVLDLMIPRLHGLEVIRQLHKSVSETSVIVARCIRMNPRHGALRNGASGYVLKECTAAELVQAVRSVAAGRRYLSPALGRTRVDGLRRAPGPIDLDVYDTLTNRERETLQLAAAARRAPRLAAAFVHQPPHAETHRANLMQALSSLADRLVRYSIRKGIISA